MYQNSVSPAEVDYAYEYFLHVLDGLRHGCTVAQMMGITPDECEALYTLCYNLHRQGHYNEAFRIFNQLVMHDHLNDRYLMALAGTAQLLERHKEALQYYAAVTLIRLNDPEPLLHSAECLIALSREDEAIEALDIILSLDSGSAPEIKQRAHSLLSLLHRTTQETQSVPAPPTH